MKSISYASFDLARPTSPRQEIANPSIPVRFWTGLQKNIEQ